MCTALRAGNVHPFAMHDIEMTDLCCMFDTIQNRVGGGWLVVGVTQRRPAPIDAY